MGMGNQGDGETILVVEDSLTQRMLVKHLLEGAGYRVETADDGAQALARLQTQPVDLILSDINMPGMDGITLCSKVKSDPQFTAIPFVMLSSLIEMTEILSALEAGADNYITKPFEIDQLLSKLAEELRGPTAQPLADSAPLPVELEGSRFSISAQPERLLKFLITTYGAAVRNNAELIEANKQLQKTRDELMQRTRQLEESEEHFRALVETVPDVIYRIDKEGCFEFINHAVEKLGYKPEELVGKHFSAMICPEDLEQVSRQARITDGQGQEAGVEDQPKLFDERRSGERKTLGLEVKVKLGNHTMDGEEPEACHDAMIVEVNSSGLHASTPKQGDGGYVGTVGAIRDITVRKQNEGALIRAKHEAEEATRLKDQFVSLVAHDLRAPLTSILTLIDLIKADEKGGLTTEGGPALTSVMQEITSTGDNMVKTIDNLLSINRVRGGLIHLDYVFIDLSQNVSMVMDRLRPLAERKGISLINDVDEGEQLYVDQTLFFEVLINLISNAIKFTDSGGSVTAFVPHGQEGFLSIRDTGVGIEETLQKSLFVMDAKPLTLGTHGEKGTGFGLPLSAEIIQSHGGQIWVDSDLGKGSTFSLSVPLSPSRQVFGG
uniref:histidine kinase n=1 Tax=Magnetococcus massalia (strain MO-1) TaxID=451514 RepID=A0A1S7LGD7_MAGMO|nr:putative Histidine kinase [Candidatus Magnetococcus massalia]